MFQISGPLPLSQTNATEKTELNFRPLQRVTAEVIQVTATQAILSIDGKPVVAQLSSSDQAAALREQRVARFIVSQAEENNIVFKLVQSGQPSNSQGTAIKQDLALRFLGENQIPVTENNLTLMQAMLNQRLPLSADLFHELSTVLQSLNSWDPQTANLAAALKAAGLPLTPESLALASQLDQLPSGQLADLMQVLQQAAGRENLPENLSSLLKTVTTLLEQIRPNLEGSREQIAEALEKQVNLFGRSFENVVQHQLTTKNPFWPEDNLVLLSRLQTLAKESGETDLSNALSRVLEQAHQNQFLNIPTQNTARAESWIQLPIFLQQPGQAGQMVDQKAQFRVTRRSTIPGAKIDPANTYLSIEMDLENGESIQVGLSLLGKQAQANITVTSQTLAEAAEQEIPQLENGMKELGYLLSDSTLKIGQPEQENVIDISSNNSHSFITVNLEI